MQKDYLYSESDQTLAAAVSPKESSGEDKEVCLTTKEILSDPGFPASIDDINEADLVRPLLPKDMERLTNLRAGIEGPLLSKVRWNGINLLPVQL